MRIGVPKESAAGETLVAMTPKTAVQLVGLGYEVVMESGAGGLAKFADEAYEAAGARIAAADEVWTSDVVLKVNEPTLVEVARLAEGAIAPGPDGPG